MWTATTRARSRTTWTIGRSRAMCATRHLRRTASRGTRKQHFAERLNLPAPSLSGPVTSGEGRLQVHFAQWGESVGGTKSHPTRARARANLSRWRRCRSPSTTTWSRQSRRIEPCQRQGKWPDRPLDHRSGCPRVPVAVRTSRLSSREEGKAIIFTPVRESSGESQLRSLPQIPLGRLGEPEEIAGLIIYLCSDGAAFVTGANIAINGGQHMQ